MASNEDACLQKPNTKRKRDNNALKENARVRAHEKLGKEEAERILRTFPSLSSKEGDCVIRQLLSQGLSQVEVRALVNVGGSRVGRLQKLLEPEVPVFRHALSTDEKLTIGAQIETWNIETGHHCTHREPLEFFTAPDIQWQHLYQEYKAKQEKEGKRVISMSRWREYVRAFHPRLRLGSMESNICNVCTGDAAGLQLHLADAFP